MTHLDESEIVDLEKRFWALADTNPSKRIDLATVRSLVAPPFPNDLVLGFFSALDENQVQTLTQLFSVCCLLEKKIIIDWPK